MCWSHRLRTTLLGALLGCQLCVTPCLAQSAADKATARELASDGVKKFNAGNPKGALQSLQKAQALYDAPIHLLYIARSHAELGQLIEAVESYRSLLRVVLPANAPQVFVEAQEDGRRELAEVEPRLARLTIEVTPEDVQGLSLSVDGLPINVAALSVARPSNPGEHIVEAEAPGYKVASHTITLSEGGEATVELELEAEPDFEPDSGPDAQTSASTAQTSAAQWRQSGPYGLIFGLRYGGIAPLGDLESGQKMFGYYGLSGMGRVELGVRFMHYFGAKFYAGGSFAVPGRRHEEYAKSRTNFLTSRDSTTTSAKTGDVGFALMATSNPRQFGGFGELGFTFLHGYQWKRELVLGESNEVLCSERINHRGLAGRVGVGANLPVHRIVNIVPVFDVTVGTLSRGKKSQQDPCEQGANGEMFPDLPLDLREDSRKAVHYQLFFGVGVDMHFGDGWFQKADKR